MDTVFDNMGMQLLFEVQYLLGDDQSIFPQYRTSDTAYNHSIILTNGNVRQHLREMPLFAALAPLWYPDESEPSSIMDWSSQVGPRLPLLAICQITA